MPRILVVDDSPIDRAFVAGLLKKEPGLEVGSAVNGADALSQISESIPDLVVSDLQMPEMDGLALVAALRVHFPQAPVILITAHGSEQLAVEALEQGAASYVPKSQLAKGLVAAVRQVLDLAREHQGYEDLSAAMEYAQFRFRAPNDLALCERLVELAQQLAGSIGVCDVGGQVRIGMALEEALKLMLLCGNLELPPSALLALSAHEAQGDERLAQRMAAAPFSERKLLVRLLASEEELRLDIGHEGPPLQAPEADVAASSPALESPLDRSLILMRAFMDLVSFSPDGRCVTLVKHAAGK